MKPENLLSILIDKCSKIGADTRKVRLGQLLKNLERCKLPMNTKLKNM